ncbi:MAG: iron transport multicopper oxidase FET3 [Lasallia pustulata]|uniref:Iron transport multicopper oxidase FET3 n=1 Tax=Lasallia pustulata TaxID=136370 RepID=A0A5M8PRL9_9LECA|nr:MAG: iron transport multicopper oxidase FET3 [Lasallia pustulata]
MIESPDALQASLTIPADHLAACAAAGLPTSGNAAGHTADFFDLAGENKPPGPLPAGFTAGGIVALVFSCVGALMGLAVITWYGVGEIGAKEEARLEGEIEVVAERVGVEVGEPLAVGVQRRGRK